MNIELTQERVRELFDYDEENGLLIRKFKSGKRKPCGHKPATSCGYGQVNIDGKMHRTHRLIWLWFYGSWPESEIDHLDRNKMNNRIDNLRNVTSSENQHNNVLRRNNSSGFPGVSWYKAAKKFQARIGINNKLIYLGYYTTAEEAFLTYQLAKIKYLPSSPIAQEYYRELTLAG